MAWNRLECRTRARFDGLGSEPSEPSELTSSLYSLFCHIREKVKQGSEGSEGSERKGTEKGDNGHIESFRANRICGTAFSLQWSRSQGARSGLYAHAGSQDTK